MTIEINGMNLDDIKDAQDILVAFLALQLQTEKSTEELARILDKAVEIAQASNNTHLSIQDLMNSMQEILKRQESFIKNQKTEQNNLIRTEELIQKTNKSLNLLRNSLEEVEERTNRISIFSKILGGAILLGGVSALWVYHETVFSFIDKVLLYFLGTL